MRRSSDRLIWSGLLLLPEALSFEFNSVGVVDSAIEGCVGHGGVADDFVPAVDGQLAGDNDRASFISVLDNLKQITALVGVERLWRSLKHEDIYLKGYADGREAKAGIANWIAFNNGRRLHQALGYRAPMAVWRERMQAAKAVDMMDNADALTTCPQQQQQTKSLAA